MTFRSLSPLFLLTLFGCAAASSSPGVTQSTAAETVRHPADPVSSPEAIPVELTHENRHLERVYVPATKDGLGEHVILDSGTARTWFRLDGATQDFTADAFVGRFGDSALSVFGRRVPAFDEIVDGRPAIGAIGIDFFSAGPTELDLRNSRLIRYPAHSEVPGGASGWPAIALQKTRGLIHGVVTLDGVPRRVLIDTGAPTSMLLASGEPGDTPRTDHDVFGNPFPVWDGHARLELDPRLGSSEIVITRAPKFPHLQETAAAMGVDIEGILGLSSLGSGRVVFDVDALALRFEPPT
jgi:hypothetical protein